MKTINTILKESPLNTLPNFYKYAVLCLFSGIVIIAFSLLIFVLKNLKHVGNSFLF